MCAFVFVTRMHVDVVGIAGISIACVCVYCFVWMCERVSLNVATFLGNSMQTH